MPELLSTLTSSMSGSRGGSPVHTFSAPDFVGGYGGQVSSHCSVMATMLLNSVQIFMLSMKHAAPPPSSSWVSARLLSAMHTTYMVWQAVLRDSDQGAVLLKQTKWPNQVAAPSLLHSACVHRDTHNLRCNDVGQLGRRVSCAASLPLGCTCSMM